MSFLKDKKIVVTGGGGFLGSYVLDELKNFGCEKIFSVRSSDYDLTTEKGILGIYSDFAPDVVIHLAAAVGGIGANQAHPGSFFYKNALMGIQLIEYARKFGVKKFVTIGTTCSYPENTPIPFKEENLWDGYPAHVTAPYGIAKKMLLVQSQAYRQEYGFNGIYLIPVNLYGPKDNFAPESSHVIPALIKKIVEAKEQQAKTVVCWGTGEATREFIYVKDCAEAIVLASDKYDGNEPVNVGTGQEIKIKNLVKIIAEVVGYTGEIVWDSTKPEGQPRRCVDVSRAKSLFEFEARTDILDGIRKTVEWYMPSESSL